MRWPVQLLLVALIWGASFMFIKVELDAGIAPVHVAFLRCAFGAPALLLILAGSAPAIAQGQGIAQGPRIAQVKSVSGQACRAAARLAPFWPSCCLRNPCPAPANV